MHSLHRILGSASGRVLLTVAAGLTVVGTAQSLRSAAAAAALAGFGVLWIRLGTLDQRIIAARVPTSEFGPGAPESFARRRRLDREQLFSARADITVLMGFGWIIAGWLGLVTAAVAAAS